MAKRKRQDWKAVLAGLLEESGPPSITPNTSISVNPPGNAPARGPYSFPTTPVLSGGPSITKTAPPGTPVNSMSGSSTPPPGLVGTKPSDTPLPDQFPYQPMLVIPNERGKGFNEGEVYFQYATTGYSLEELKGIARSAGARTPTEIAYALKEYFAPMGGAAPPSLGENIPPGNQAIFGGLQGGKQARDWERMLIPTEEGKRPGVKDWAPGYVSRGDDATMWPVKTYYENWLGISKNGNLLVTQDQSTIAGRNKTSKRTQNLAGQYETVDLFGPSGESLMVNAPNKIGPGSRRVERGIIQPMLLITQDILPEGMMYIPANRIGGGTGLRTREIWTTGKERPNFVEPGTTFNRETGVTPFEGASPMDFGSADWVTFKGAIAEQQTRKVRGKKVEGTLYRMQFQVGMNEDTLLAQNKTGPFKYIVDKLAKPIPGFKGYGIAQLKDLSGSAFTYWMGHPEQAAEHLGLSQEEYAQKNWMDVSYELGKEFSRLASTPLEEGGLYTEQKVSLGVWHESEIDNQLDRSQFNITPVKGEEGYFNVETKNPVGVLVVDKAFLQFKRGYGVNQRNISPREWVALQKANPLLAKEIEKESEFQTFSRMQAISATLASEGKAGLPPDTVKLNASDVEQTLGAAEAAALAEAGVSDTNKLPPGLLERFIIKEAAKTWGSKPIALNDKVTSMSPAALDLFSAMGLQEGTEASAVGRSFASVLLDFGNEEAFNASVERYGARQALLAKGKNFKNRALRAYTRRVIAGKLKIDNSLPANMVSAPVSEVLRAYNLKPGTKEAIEFEAAWEANLITPQVYATGQPSPGSQVFEGTFGVVHPKNLKSKGKLGKYIALGAVAAQALGRDADGDDIYLLADGRVVADKEGGPVVLENFSGSRQYSPGDIRAMSDEAVEMGRPSLARNAVAQTPGEMGNLLNPDKWNEVSPQQLEEDFQTTAKLGERIGSLYTTLEDVKDVASELGLPKEAGERFMRSIHGRTQGKFQLPPDLDRAARVLSSMTPKGGIRAEIGNEEGKDFTYSGKRGITGARRDLLEALAGGKSLSADLAASMLFPKAGKSKAAALIEKYRATQGNAHTAIMRKMLDWGLIGSQDEWVKNTPLGGVIGARFAVKKGSTSENLGLSQETFDLSLRRKEAMQQRRAIFSKQRGGLVEFIEGLVKQKRSEFSPKVQKLIESVASSFSSREVPAAAPAVQSLSPKDTLSIDDLNALAAAAEENKSPFEIKPGKKLSQVKNPPPEKAPQTASRGAGGAAGPPPPPPGKIPTETGNESSTLPEGNETPKLPSNDKQQLVTQSGDKNIYADEATGAVFKKLPEVSFSEANQALTELKIGLPTWTAEVYPTIQSGGIITSKQSTFTRALGKRVKTLQRYQGQTTGPITNKRDALLGEIGSMFSPKGMGQQLTALQELGPTAAFVQQVDAWMGGSRGSGENLPTGILGNVSAAELEQISGIGPARSRALLGGAPTSFKDVQGILESTGAGSARSRLMALGVINRAAPWQQRLETLMRTGRLQELPGIGPSTAPDLEFAIQTGVSSVQGLANLVPGIGEKKAIGIAEALSSPAAAQLDKTAEALKKFDAAVTKSEKTVIKYSNTMQTQVENFLSGKLKPSREWAAGVARMGAKAAGVVSAAEAAGIEAPAWATGVKSAAEKAAARLEEQGLGEAFGPPPGAPSGITAGLAGIGKQLMSGWGLMQLNRMWSLTGAPVFNQMIPAAAQAEMAGWQATQALSGIQGGLPGGVAGGVIQSEAAKRQALIEAGRTGYRAWGGMQRMGSGALQQARAIGGPAAGAGLIGGLGAMWAGLPALPIGLGIGAAALAYGGASYLSSYGTATSENQLELASAMRSGSILDQIWAANRSAIGRTISQSWQGITQRPLSFLAQGGVPGQAMQAVQWTMGQTSTGVGIQNTPIGQLNQQQQMAAINSASGNLGGGAWEGVDEGQRNKALAQYFTYFKESRGMTQAQIEANVPEYLLSTDVSQYEPLAGQLRLGTEGAGQLSEKMSKYGLGVQREMRHAFGLLAPLTNFGVSGEEIANAVFAAPRPTKVAGGWSVDQSQNPWLNLTDQQETMLRRLGRRSPYAISQLGQAIGRPDLQTMNPVTGMSIGSNWGGDILGNLVGQTAYPNVNVQNGMVTLGTQNVTFGPNGIQQTTGQQQVGFTRWDLQRYQSEERYNDQMAQLGFSRQQFAMSGAWLNTARGLENAQRQRGYDWQQQQFGFQQEGFDLGNRQWQESFGLRQRTFEATTQYQRQNMNIQYGRQMTRLNWAAEDLAFGGQQAALQYGFGMEDIQQNLRYATGRQRRDLLRQQQRQTLMYGMGMAQRETQGERLDTQKEWAKEDRDRQKDFFEHKIKWTREEMALALKHHNEDTEFSQRKMDAVRKHYETEFRFQDKRIEKERKYQDEQRDFQKAQLDYQEDQIKKWKDYTDAVTANNEAIETQMANYNAEMDALLADQGMVLGLFTTFLNTLSSVSGHGGFIQGNTYTTQPSPTPVGH